jgi:thymidylate synthase (FAD)
MSNVKLLNFFGNDLMVCDAARVSYDKEASQYTEEQNIKLLNFLLTHKHTAPFYHPKVQFRITCPIYVERQLTKTSIGVDLNKEIDVDINSISGRYVDFSDSYTKIDKWRYQSKSSKQGSDSEVDSDTQAMCEQVEEQIINECKKAYDYLISMNIAKEQARSILPLNLNTTFIWTGSLFALLRLTDLRMKPDAQLETGNIVRAMVQELKNLPENPFKHTFNLYKL